MKPARSPVARAVVGAFADAPVSDRFHVWYRWASCPFEAVEAAVPRTGRVLELGCGHGLCSLHLARTSPHRQVLGVDIDAHKIPMARAAAERLAATAPVRPLDVTFEHRPAADGPPDGPFDAIVIVDVIYLMDTATKEAIVGACADRLAPGGTLIVKEMGDRPAWKLALTGAQERLATGMLGITEGGSPDIEPVDRLAPVLEARGLVTEVAPLGAGYLYPHTMLVGRAPH